MLTVKVMSPDGGEEIHSGLSVGFNPNQQSIAVSGMDQNVFLKQGSAQNVSWFSRIWPAGRTPGGQG
ncbi:TPA: hypothetical protein L9S24_002280 [Klebsiella pneumoniae]|uniref:hypothetical protein n=1 Tax=Klebsiella pneumoniae TaxID=573 RepID=UPI0010C3287A|nr:hypothetical protein [Klebsiella pneumoniae]VTO18813.1 Uncharacterised protein [Klebsiella pneumoniae]HBR3311723.1 hypothetical protein [Klebsiella pneumoniae]HBR4320578.1 hypothetical protein [Klebsiella pneumoniae]